MPQCQPAWLWATLFAMMERETDWTAHVSEALVVCNGLRARGSVKTAFDGSKRLGVLLWNSKFVFV